MDAEPPPAREAPGAQPAVSPPEAPSAQPPRALEPPRHEGRPEPAAQPRAKLAIVIDDLGHSLGETQRFLALGYPLTYSILPDVPHARDSAALVHAAGGQYIIHLPMQPFDYPRENPGPYPLLLSQSLDETARRLRSGRSGAIGVVVPAEPGRFDPFFLGMLAAVGPLLAKAGLSLVMMSGRPGPEEMHAYRHRVESHRVEGVLLARTRRRDPRIAYLMERKIPFVAHGRTETRRAYAHLDLDGLFALAR